MIEDTKPRVEVSQSARDAAEYHCGPWDDECPEDEDDCEADCGLMPDGQCMLAGTEFCDWDCGRLG